MSADKNWQFELEEYIKQGEPGQIEKSEAWQTAIGLQAVDGLQTSAYLLDTAKDHIEGKISIDEAQKRIQSYYIMRSVQNARKLRPILRKRIGIKTFLCGILQIKLAEAIEKMSRIIYNIRDKRRCSEWQTGIPDRFRNGLAMQ